VLNIKWLSQLIVYSYMKNQCLNLNLAFYNTDYELINHSFRLALLYLLEVFRFWLLR